jgi:uncharacterized protein
MWGRYRVTDPDDFFNRVGAWNVARDPETPEQPASTGATTTTNVNDSPTEQDRIDPYYLLTSLPGQEQEEFVQLRPFTPIRGDARPVLTGFLTASSDGELLSFETPPTSQVDGPSLVAGQIRSFEPVSEDQTQLCRPGSGSTCDFGNLVFVPIEQGIIYVQPLYITAEGSRFPVLRKVIVEFNGEVGYADTLRDALLQIFDEVPETLEEDTNAPPETGGEEDPEEDPAVLLNRAEQLFDEAEAALQEGGVAAFGEYAEKIAEARELIERARELLGEPAAGESPASSTSTTSTTSTTEPDSA